jgi:expansin (peptidoglycan-binding protein)
MGSEAPEPPALDIIDDFEDGDNVVSELEGRAGHWGAYNDGTGTQTPAAGAALSPEEGGANGSALALHTSGSGFTDWGAGLQVDLNNTGSGAASRQPFDASAYTGVTFYARGSGELRVEFVTRETSESSQGGTCVEGCYDAHGSAVLALTAEWKAFTLHFEDLAQEGWGTAVDFSAASLLGLNFKALKGATADATFDLWLDELRFSTALPGSNPDDPGTPEPEPEPDPGPISEPGMCGGELGSYDGNGSVTMYWFDQGSAEVNCSFEITGRNPDKVAHVTTGEGRFFGAMNTSDYNTAAMCGACVEVTRDGGRKVTITIVDQCPIGTNPKCTAGHIDLSRDAFHEIGADNEGHLGTGNGGATGNISWRYVPCPVTGNVIFKWKKGAEGDQYWDELLVQNTPYAITSVEIDGQPATRKEYNYWEPPAGVISTSKDTYRVRVTDVKGSVIEATIERPAAEVDAGVQLTCE